MQSGARVTMYGEATYELRIQGVFDESWIRQMHLDLCCVESDSEHGHVSVLVGTFRDQAELRSVLDRLYTLNLPLISLQHIENP